MTNQSIIIQSLAIEYKQTAQTVVLVLSALLSACDQPDQDAHISPLTTKTLSQIERGQYLAIASNCAGCHTSTGKAPYSGGRAIPTPFGEVLSSNLTADPETGLGQWSSDDFWQALHNGISRDGRSLYPAFPYPSYSLITRDDSDALFTYLQSIPAVKQRNLPHRLRFPYSSQWALNAWRSLHFTPKQFSTDSEKTEKWNRGAYLVKGLGHCGACHTPRGMLGNYDKNLELQGSHVAGLDWSAPSLSKGTLSTLQLKQLVQLLKTGINERDVLSGPMADVAGLSLQYLDIVDLEAMAEYLSSLPKKNKTIKKRKALREEMQTLGAAVYKKHCSDCHGDEGQGQPYRYPALAGNSALTMSSPRNAIRSLMFGGFGASTTGRPRPYGMPAFAHQLSDHEAAAVLSYVRSAWGNNANPVGIDSIWRQ